MASLRRFWRITRTVSRYRLDTLLRPHVSRRVAWLLALNPLRLGGAPPDLSRGRRLTLALQDLGPVFVKFGQLLSTRRDLIPLDIADELAALQDDVPPFAPELAREALEQALGADLAASFSSFEAIPMASASVAQVHAAELENGEQVVVKIVRPDIEVVIREDIELISTLAAWLDRKLEEARRLHLPAVVADYERTIFGELDMRREAANTEQLRQNFAESELLYVPRVHHELCRKNVLVLERIYGVPIAEVAELKRRGTDMKRLAERGVETFFTQVFVHNFFHADMHPGNIFVNVEDPADPSYIAIDCAIIGSLTAEDQDYLARNLLAFFNRDYAQVARLLLESGWVPDGTDTVAFERVIREVCEPIFAKPLNQISFGQFLVQLFQAARDFNLEVQPQLVLLQKTLLYIEGLGRELYPQLDLWETAKPFMEDWMVEQVGPAATLREFAEHAPELLELLPKLPSALLDASAKLRVMERTVARQGRELEDLKRELKGQRRARRWRQASGLVLLLLASGLLLGAGADTTGVEDSSTLAGVLSAAVGSLLLLRA
jgi:ubiquinone biosynthesis protein